MRTTHDPPHLRHDPLTARTVVVAPGRADRPNELEGATVRCPFCAGNESLTPPDLLRSPRSLTEPWRARIVPNRFPIAVDATDPRTAVGIQGERPQPAHGVHDVVIESPAHVRSILAIDPAGWRAVWELCRERLAVLADRGDIAWAMVFKNSGVKAVAASTTDPFGNLLRQATAEDRIVMTVGDLVALVPPAPRQPFETWILPRSAEGSFHATSPDRVAALAELTQSLIGRLDRLMPGVDYNWWLHQLPHAHAVGDAAAPASWHWHLEILPRINGLAGFELGTGCHITTMTPYESARLLRDA